MTQEQYEKVLPDFMRDFHDQKDLFKAIYELYSGAENKISSNWVDSHIFTIDFFLWFMAKHGYRLQRFKSKKFQQYDVVKTISEQREKRLNSLSTIISETKPPTE